MVDLSYPKEKILTIEEKESVVKNFLLLVHSFLLFYLFLHNLIIPLVINLLRGNFLLTDVHYWFLFHIPVHLILRRNKELNRSFVLFLVFGSLFRIFFYSFIHFSRSWSLVSVYLSEFSSLIFLFAIYGKAKRDKFILFALTGFLVPFGLSFIEVDSLPKKTIFAERDQRHFDYSLMGCRGSRISVEKHNFHQLPLKKSVLIGLCGFEENAIRIEGLVDIKNYSGDLVNLRLYELIKRDERFTWKFLKMIRLEKNMFVNLGKDLNSEKLYLVKSPERRGLGMILIGQAKLPFDGKLLFTFDSVEWRP